MSFEHLELALDDAVALIRFARPGDNTHVLSTACLRELQEALTRVSESPATRVLMLTGKGRSFSVGADLGEINNSAAGELPALLRAGQSAVRQLLDLEALTIAAINGLALGGGLELALACDVRWAHVSAVVGFPEARLGLLPGWGGMALLSRLAPASLCADLIASGELIGARRACEAGLVSRVFDSPNFESTALAEAHKLAGRPLGALTEIKTLLRQVRGDVDLTAGDVAFLNLGADRAASRGTAAALAGGAGDHE